MAGKTIEAILRLSTDVAAAVAGLRQVRAEAVKTNGTGGTGGAAVQAEKQTTSAVQTERAKRTAAQKAADQADLAAARAAAKAKAAEEAKARREARAAEDAENARKRREDAQAYRNQQSEQARQKRSANNDARKLAQVAPQLTDVATQLAGGQNPALVLLQQGGQLRDVFGSAGTAGKALMSVLTPTRLIIGGMVASAALFVSQIIAGHRESETLRRTLALTGNAAGTSLGQINGLAKSISSETGTSIGLARDALAALLTVSGQTANTLGSTGKAVVSIAKLTGQAAEDVVKGFQDQAAGVTDWAAKANRAYNFLTPAQVAYIRQLEQQGRIQEAIRFTNDQLSQSLVQRTGPALGSLERGWAAVTKAMGGFLDQLKAIGRDDTAEERLARLQRKIDETRARQAQGLFAGRRKSTDQADIADAQGEQGTINRGLIRQAEGAIAAQERQREIDQQSLSWQEAVTARTLANEQKRTAGINAELDRRQSAVELADARGLMSERDKALALNEIDQGRLRAQLTLEKAQEAEQKRLQAFAKSETEAMQAQTRVTQAAAQVAATQSRLAAATSERQRIVDADALAKARERAQAWAQVWQQAADQVRALGNTNASNAAVRLIDPGTRAQAEAKAGVAELQRSLDETTLKLKAEISLTTDPGMKAELQKQLASLQREGQTAINDATNKTVLQSLNTQASEQMEKLRLSEAAITAQVERGALTTEEAEQRKFEARDRALPQLRQMLVLMKGLAATEADRNAIEGLLQQLDQLSNRTTEFQRTMRESSTSNLSTMFTDIATGAEKADRAVAKFFANVLKSALDLIARQLSQKLMQSIFGNGGTDSGWWGAAVKWFAGLGTTGEVKHGGGVIGSGGVSRTVAPWIFHGAQVLHSGGLAGLKQGEVPAILMRGEEVLTASDPRHRNNLGAAGNGALVGNLNVSVNVESTGGAASDQVMSQKLAGLVRAAIEQKLADEMRPGGMLQHVAR